MPKCSQCEKPAVVYYPNMGLHLCLEHNLEFQERTKNLIKFYADLASQYQTEGLISMGLLPPAYQALTALESLPDQASMTFNNFNINNSTIGAINTGRIRALDVAIDAMKQRKPELTSLLKQFTQAVINDNNIADATRNEILESASFIANQLTLPKEMRTPSITNDVLDKTHKVVTGLAGLFAIWQQLQPLIRSVLAL